MKVQRLDVGADVVHIPTRDLLVIHPDLEFGEAIGAVKATCPAMHMDAVVAAVEQVTPRPKPQPRKIRLRLSSMLVAVALSLGFGVATLNPAAATMFGETWSDQMNRLGLACERADDSTLVTCTEQDGSVTKVAAYRREDRTLYVVRRNGPDHCLLIFDTEGAAQRWADSRIDATVTGRVAVLS